jgi:hypothetical protein
MIGCVHPKRFIVGRMEVTRVPQEPEKRGIQVEE